MTIKNNEPEIPVAQTVWEPNGTETEAIPELQAQLLPDAESQATSSFMTTNSDSAAATNKKTDDSKNASQSRFSNSSFHLTTGQGEQQAYWGRFNDPHGEVLPTYDDNDDVPVATARPDDRQVRLTFIRKVYSILSVQLLVTFGVCAIMALNTSVRSFALGAGLGLYYLNIGITLGSICALHVYKRSYPTNYYLLAVFTISMSYMVGTVTAMYEEMGAGDLVVEALFITATVFIVLTIFTLQSKWDFSFMGAGLGMCLWIMLLWGIFGMIFGLQTGSVYALLGSVLFSLYIIYDTYMIAERLDPEDYIVGAIELYLDLVNLFLYILRLLSEMNRR